MVVNSGTPKATKSSVKAILILSTPFVGVALGILYTICKIVQPFTNVL